MRTTIITAFVLCSALGSACEKDGDGGDSVSDAGVLASDSGLPLDGSLQMDGGPAGDGGINNELISTLSSDCGAGLQGRAVVNENGNLGISFTEDSGAFTFLGSMQFELTSGFSGTVDNPENWDGKSDRQIVAVTTNSFTLHGNHCWLDGDPQTPGSVNILDYRPGQGIVHAEFSNFQLRSCVGATVCTINGSIETTGEGVFD